MQAKRDILHLSLHILNSLLFTSKKKNPDKNWMLIIYGCSRKRQEMALSYREPLATNERAGKRSSRKIFYAHLKSL